MTTSATLEAPAVTPRPRPTARARVHEHWPHYLAVSPFYILFLLFGAFPIGFSIYLSFHSWDGIGAMRYVGFAEYRYLLSDPAFWHSVLVTLQIWVISTVPTIFFALALAFALHSTVRLQGIYRVAYFLPNVTSTVAITIVFGSIFSSSFGLANAALHSVGLGQVGWLTTPWGIRVAVAAIVIWRWTGYNAIIFLAGLQSISPDLNEAARVDGASSVQIFFRITIPMLRPVILFSVILSTIGGWQLFAEPQVLVGNDGGPGQAGQTVVLYMYEHAFVNHEFGYGAAVSWALFVLIVLFSVINWRLISGEQGRQLRRTVRNAR